MSTSCIGCDDAFESDDSFATMSVRSEVRVSTKKVEAYGLARLTAGGVLFLVVVRHDGCLVCGMEVVIESERFAS